MRGNYVYSIVLDTYVARSRDGAHEQLALNGQWQRITDVEDLRDVASARTVDVKAARAFAEREGFRWGGEDEGR